ncbi:hypothetical protein [Massilia orientalis]|uniref:Uncharacterized protein n=1 Tax=Massilia orientalis TaxID=3050128 RepID=A0ACC7MIQ0_9BURK|nr:hypothetical protein [Massilia sp. YIM B02787]
MRLEPGGVWITPPVAEGVRPETPLIPKIPAENQVHIAAAVEVAKRSDVIVLVVWDKEQVTRETVRFVTPATPLCCPSTATRMRWSRP